MNLCTPIVIAKEEKWNSDFVPLQEFEDAQEKTYFLSQLRDIGLQAMTWDKFEMSTRPKNCLIRAKVQNVWEAMQLSREEVLRLPGSGEKVRAEIYTQVLKESGVKLPQFNDVLA